MTRQPAPATSSAGEWQADLDLKNLKPGTQYAVSVQAANAQGWGALSDGITVRSTRAFID